MKNNLPSRFFYITGIITTIAFVIGIGVFATLKILASEPTNFSYNDSPYIYYLNDSTVKTITVIDNNVSDFIIHEKTINTKDKSELNNLSKEYPGFKPFEKFEFSSLAEYDAEKIAAISDIHGSFHHFTKLLQANKIIDDSLNWNWGKGHLVIVGDVFDKGLYVSECFWLIKKLEVQSFAQGGRVHFLLGNHEKLILSGNCNYIDNKYIEICKRLYINYNQLFANNTYWGQWLRSKNIIVKINNNLFTHGGISEQMLNKKFTLTEVNRLFNSWLNTPNSINFDEKTRSNFNLLINYFGPLEYRGYFNKNIFNRGQAKSFPEATIDKILKHYKVEHLIIGHTIVKEVKGLFNNKVIAINNRFPEDDMIDKKSNCEMLIIEGANYFKAGLNGSKILLF